MAQEWVEDLEKDLAEAVEVKNRDSLHRYISRLAEHFGRTGESGSGQPELASVTNFGAQISTLLTEIRAINARIESMQISMDKRFEELTHYMDKRFEAVDKRFEDMQKSMDKRFEAVDKRFEDMQNSMEKRFEAVDKRFEDMNKRFNGMQALLALGFTVLATMMTVIRLFG
ncbi:MAG: hypothetical protein EA428_12675 [Spirochaetaceae bacterium]|nr:MAG: hypothetical protein EA428_12675 [Spirochaetaceae bacterium]